MPTKAASNFLDTRFFPSAEPSTRLMVVLHGLGDSMEGFFWLPSLMALPNLNYLLVNAPDPYTIGFAWFDIDNPAPGVLRSRRVMQALFAELAAQGWESRDVFLFGFSQGCLISLDFALRHDQPLAGIVGVSGYIHEVESYAGKTSAGEIHPAAREQSWLVTHGLYDELLPIARTRGQMEQIRAAGVPIEWEEYPKGHTIDPEKEMDRIRNWVAARLA